MSKIAPISGRFENMAAFLARIAEDEQAVGFVGLIVRLRDDGSSVGVRDMVPVNFKTTKAECAFASVALAKMALEDE